MTCPHCKEAIEGIQASTYWVGWCRKEIHRACFLLHARSCQACRWHNEEVLAHDAPR